MARHEIATALHTDGLRELKAAGFVDVAVEPYQQFVTIDSAEDLWFVMTRSAAPCVKMRKRLGEDEWARRSQLSKARLEQTFASGPRRLSTTAYPGFGGKPEAS